jgi:hypothetical protein
MTTFTRSRIFRSAFHGLVLTTLVANGPGCTEQKQPETPKAQAPGCVGLGCEKKECIGLGCDKSAPKCIGMGCEKKDQADPANSRERN